jgi:hypothetical protein
MSKREGFLKRFNRAAYTFIFGTEIELGDSIFFTVLTLVLLGLLWLMTLEKYFGIPVEFVLIPWAVLVFFLWRGYSKSKKARGKK